MNKDPRLAGLDKVGSLGFLLFFGDEGMGLSHPLVAHLAPPTTGGLTTVARDSSFLLDESSGVFYFFRLAQTGADREPVFLERFFVNVIFKNKCLCDTFQPSRFLMVRASDREVVCLTTCSIACWYRVFPPCFSICSRSRSEFAFSWRMIRRISGLV